MKKIIGTIFGCFILATLIGITGACEKIIPFDADVSSSKLVVNSFFSTDSVWNVHISNSLSVVDQANLKNIENATVQIKNASGNVIENLTHTGNGFYKGASYPSDGTNYTVEVSASGYKSITAQDYIPNRPVITAVDTASGTVEGEPTTKITVSFNDPSGANYYQLELNIATWEYIYNNGVITDSVFHPGKSIEYFTSDPSFENPNEGWNTKGLFKDLLFDGQSKTISVQVAEGSPNGQWGRVDHIDAIITSSTKVAYNYNLSYQLFQNNSGNPFAQPVQVYSNVDKGFGVFAGVNRTLFRRNF